MSPAEGAWNERDLAAFYAARDSFDDLIGWCTQQFDREQKKPTPDPRRLDRLRRLRAELAAERRDFDPAKPGAASFAAFRNAQRLRQLQDEA